MTTNGPLWPNGPTAAEVREACIQIEQRINRNTSYLTRRARRGTHTAYDQVLNNEQTLDWQLVEWLRYWQEQ